MKTAAVLGTKGGSGKTATAHLLCLGAYLHGIPAAYVLTDPQRKLRGEGRPYAVLDGRLPDQLAIILASRQASLNGWLILDGGGNRPEFDKELANNVDLILVPYKNNEEDFDTAAQSLTDIPNALAWPCAWPTNPYASAAAQYLIDGMSKAFPLRVVAPPIPFVNSASDLLSAELATPSSPVRQIAKKAFSTMLDYYDSRLIAGEETGDGPAAAAGR